eukprot:1084475-Rhodomonas_salina.1
MGRGRVGRVAAAGARTFCFEEEVAQMRRLGLAQGGSLLNAVVFDKGGRVLNPEGLRAPDEPAQHKALDALGLPPPSQSFTPPPANDCE